MSFSQQNRRLKDELEYRYTFLTKKNGNSIRRFNTCTFVNLQVLFLSVPICFGHMFIHSMILIMALIARFLFFSEKKILRSEIIVVPLLTDSKFAPYRFSVINTLIVSKLSKLRGHFHSCFMLNYAGVQSLAKLL